MSIQLPPIESVEHTFNFRVKATAKGGSEKYSSDIQILSVNCDYEAPSLVIEEPKTDITKDVYEINSHSIDASQYFKA